MVDPFTNPDERFDVCDASGRPTGRVKRRADVHRDGDWHRAFHCWVTVEAGVVPAVLLQRRGHHKDTWPNRLDVAVGGHFAAGETLADVVREVEEEIGREVSLADLLPLGRRIAVGEDESGIKDREIQDVYLWRSHLPLAAYRPQPIELEALVAVPLPDLLRLLAGEVDEAPVSLLRPGHQSETSAITRDDFVPANDNYYFRVTTVIDQAIKGYPYLVV